MVRRTWKTIWEAWVCPWITQRSYKPSRTSWLNCRPPSEGSKKLRSRSTRQSFPTYVASKINKELMIEMRTTWLYKGHKATSAAGWSIAGHLNSANIRSSSRPNRSTFTMSCSNDTTWKAVQQSLSSSQTVRLWHICSHSRYAASNKFMTSLIRETCGLLVPKPTCHLRTNYKMVRIEEHSSTRPSRGLWPSLTLTDEYSQ